MASSCLSGGRAYGGVDLEIIKPPSPTTSSTTRTSSSPSSTLSESSNSRLAICTRKARTARKRPNQTYNEAAALLSTAYPAIFSRKHLPKKPQKLSKQPHESLFDQASELLLPFPVMDSPGFLLHTHPILPTFQADPKLPRGADCPQYEEEEDFDTESILDEEIEEGIIDSIMGMSTAAQEGTEPQMYNPMGMGMGLGLGRFDFGFGIRRGVRPMRNADDGNWRFSPTVDVLEISPRLNKQSHPAPAPAPVDKKKKEASAKPALHLKLNYEEVLKAWSGRALPLPEELTAETDVSARLAQIDLFTESGGLREASVMRYKEKRRTRLFSKKIRYQVRKLNADRRPRMKGRFVRRSNSNTITKDEKSQTRRGREDAVFRFGL